MSQIVLNSRNGGGWHNLVKTVASALNEGVPEVVVTGPKDSSWKRRLFNEVKARCGEEAAKRITVVSEENVEG